MSGESKKNSRITEILQLVLDHSMSEKEMESMLTNFKDRYEKLIQEKNQVEDDHEDDFLMENDDEYNIPMENDEEERYCEFDVLCMYMLDYVFKRNGPTLTAVSRSLYCYLKCFNLPIKHRTEILNGTRKRFMNSLRKFTNFKSAEGKDMLIDALIKCLHDENFGLAFFLLKFGLVEIPTEANEKSRKIFEKLVDRFNDILYYTFLQPEVYRQNCPSIKPSALLDLMTRSDINLRRSLMTFFVVIVIAEFRLREKIEIDCIKEMMQFKFNSQFRILYRFFEETTETKIKIPDIEFFILNFLSPLLGADFGRSLVQFTRDNLCEFWNTSKPKSLKELSRTIIRQNLQNTMIFPEQVKQLNLPVALKEFLIFHCEDSIFDMLQRSHRSLSLGETIRLNEMMRLDEMIRLDEDILMDFEN